MCSGHFMKILYITQLSYEPGFWCSRFWNGWVGYRQGQMHICITSTPMCVFTVHKHDFDVHTAFYPHVASCPPRVPSLPLNTMVLTTLTTTVPPGTTITIGCVDGYYTDREEILTCGSDGQWRGNITQCRGMDLRGYVC